MARRRGEPRERFECIAVRPRNGRPEFRTERPQRDLSSDRDAPIRGHGRQNEIHQGRPPVFDRDADHVGLPTRRRIDLEHGLEGPIACPRLHGRTIAQAAARSADGRGRSRRQGRSWSFAPVLANGTRDHRSGAHGREHGTECRSPRLQAPRWRIFSKHEAIWYPRMAVIAVPLPHRLLAVATAFLLAFASSPPARGLAPAGKAPRPSDSKASPSPTRRDAATAVLSPSVEGEMSEADRAIIVEKLLAGLARGAFHVVPPDEVAVKLGRNASCTDAACIKKVARATGVTHVVAAKVAVADRDYHVSLSLYDGKTGDRMAHTEEGCEICGIADAGELVATAAATLRTKLEALARGPARLSIASEPKGATVSIDGEIVGTTPLDRELIPGKHLVRLTAENYVSVEREITLVEGVAENLRITLEKVPSRLPKRPWGYASLAVGIAALGTGVFFTALHDRPYKIGGNCKGGDVDARGNCRYLWDTKWYGMAGVLAGAALVTLGIAVLINTAGAKKRRARKKNRRRGKKAAARRPVFGVGPGSVSVRGRF